MGKGSVVPVQSWPDGLLKWTGHAIGANSGLSEILLLATGKSATLARVVAVNETVDEIASISTNDTARRSLALIQNLALTGTFLPSLD